MSHSDANLQQILEEMEGKYIKCMQEESGKRTTLVLALAKEDICDQLRGLVRGHRYRGLELSELEYQPT